MADYIDSLGNTMTCETEPLFDGWGWADYWICGDWITYHKMLKDKCSMTKEQATAFVEQKLTDRSLFGHEFFCGFDNNFKSYFESQGADFGFFFNITNAALDTTENVADNMDQLSKYLKIVVPVALLGIGVFYSLKAYKALK